MCDKCSDVTNKAYGSNPQNVFFFDSVSIFYENVVKSQFLQFFNSINLGTMKALRIKTFNHDLKVCRFKIVLLRDIVLQNLNFSLNKNEAYLDLKLHNGEKFLLRLPCDAFQFEIFTRRWERFKANDDYYFDLSEWTK